MDTPKLIENLFYTITIVSTFTCVIRSDYNFAFGLLCYYMIKTSKDLVQTSKPVSNEDLKEIQLLLINGALIIFDILWCITMSNVWSGKPLHHEQTWKAFDNIRTFTMILSVLNIFIRVSEDVILLFKQGAAVFFLFMIVRGSQK